MIVIDIQVGDGNVANLFLQCTLGSSGYLICIEEHSAQAYSQQLENDRIYFSALCPIYTVNFDKRNKKYILLNKHQCALTWNFKFVINKLKLFI